MAEDIKMQTPIKGETGNPWFTGSWGQVAVIRNPTRTRAEPLPSKKKRRRMRSMRKRCISFDSIAAFYATSGSVSSVLANSWSCLRFFLLTTSVTESAKKRESGKLFLKGQSFESWRGEVSSTCKTTCCCVLTNLRSFLVATILLGKLLQQSFNGVL